MPAESCELLANVELADIRSNGRPLAQPCHWQTDERAHSIGTACLLPVDDGDDDDAARA